MIWRRGSASRSCKRAVYILEVVCNSATHCHAVKNISRTFSVDVSDVRFSENRTLSATCRRKLVKLSLDKEIGRVARGKLYFNYFDSRAEKTWRVRND